MMSSADKVVPFSAAPALPRTARAPRVTTVPGLHPEAIEGLEALYHGTLTGEMRALLQNTCGLSADGFGTIDFTGRWHPEEPITVFRPSLTLAIDDEGRRWIGETSRPQGLPGPIWCVLPEPAVAVYVSDDLGAFLEKLHGSMHQGEHAKWLHDLQRQARAVWAWRQTLARESYEACRQDHELRGWLAGLPIDAHVYDLRVPSAVRGWPYGLAGPDGRFYRCARLPVFAVAAAPSTNRWRQHASQIVATGEALWPAGVRSLAA
jgi:hypothetical protein